jgi:ABC-2 type transport system permease protein
VRRIKAVVIKELRHILRDKRTLVFLLFIPAFELALYGYAIKVDIKHIQTAVLNEDGRPLSRDLVDAFHQSGYFDIVQRLDRSQDMQRLIDRGEVKAVLRIPNDFSRRVLRREGAKVQMLIDGTDPNPAQAALANSAVIAADFEKRFAHQKVSLQRVDFRPRLWYNPDLRSSWFMVPGLLALILMMLIPGMTANAIVREKERGNLEQLLVTPIRPAEFILGKILPYVVIGMLVTVSIVLAGWALFAVPVRGNFLTLMVLSLLFLTGCLSMGILLSTVAENQNQANQMIMFIAIPSILLSGFIFPREAMPAPARLLGYLIPMTYFLKILRGVLLKGVGYVDLWPQIWPLCLFTLSMVSLSVRKFRKNLG